MKNLIYILLFCSTFIAKAQDMPLVNHLFIEGIYNGKNLLVKNSFGQNGIGYCASAVYINGVLSKDGINADIFQVNLEVAGIKKGENVQVDIMYGTICTTRSAPIFMNPGALLKSTAKDPSIIFEGKYAYQNIYVNNVLVPETKAYSIKDILVNGKSIVTNINSAIFEIGLLKMNFENNAPIKIEIKYTKGYDPLIINPEALNTQ